MPQPASFRAACLDQLSLQLHRTIGIPIVYTIVDLAFSRVQWRFTRPFAPPRLRKVCRQPLDARVDFCVYEHGRWPADRPDFSSDGEHERRWGVYTGKRGGGRAVIPLCEARGGRAYRVMRSAGAMRAAAHRRVLWCAWRCRCDGVSWAAV